MLNIDSVRAQFPSLQQIVEGKSPVFFDNPAGTQVPQRVIDAVTDYYIHKNANMGGPFSHSQETMAMLQDAREVMMAFVGAAQPEEIVFGANMTTLNFAFSRALAQTIPAGAEVVLTRMDHDANVSPWTLAARDHDWDVQWVDFDPEQGTLDMAGLEAAISERTAIVAAVHASNALGTINQVQQIAEMAHSVGALFIMDAVQSAPHVRLNVQEIGCDALLCSAYKFFGPHIGVLWARHDLLESLPAYKVRPAKDESPYRWETGTLSFETIAGTAAAVRYIASLGAGETLSQQLDDAMTQIHEYEMQLSAQLIGGLQTISGVYIAGITEQERLQDRVATVSFLVDGHSPAAVVDALAAQQIHARYGDYYAVEVMQRYGRAEEGMVRVGAVHYNTRAEVDQFLNVISGL